MDQNSPLSTTKAIAENITKNIQQAFPITAHDKTLELEKIEIKDLEQLEPDNYHAVSQAKLHDKTYGGSIYGTVVLKKDGKVVDKKHMKLATVPAMVNDGTFVVDGVQYQIDSQLRLRPGVYSRIKANGEIEAHINPNGFTNMRLGIDPLTKKLNVNIHQANINALPVLRMLGIKDDQIKRTFGSEIYEANIKSGNKKEEISKFWRTLYPKDPLPATDQEIISRVASAMKAAKLDPKVTKITLGKERANLDGDTILRSFEKIVNVAKGHEEPDDRDALTFKTIHSVEDFVDERLKKNLKTIQYGIANKLYKSDDLSKIINSSHINNHVLSFFNQSSLSEVPSQINPLAIINANHKITITGEGGITNSEAIAPEMQALHPTHLGFIDPINTPESKKIGIATHKTLGVIKEGIELKQSFKNVKTNKIEHLTPIDLFDKVLALPNQELHGTVAAIKNGKQVEIDASKVTHILPNTYQAFSASSQLLPTMHFNQANRAGMAARHINQAISLTHREAPNVQVAHPTNSGVSLEKTLGDLSSASLTAPTDGYINKITESHILFKDEKGKEHKIPYFDHFEMFNKAFLHHDLSHLKPGMKFKKGELIADSNFSKDGALALGTNLHLAYMPYNGLNFEDGIVVSESAAKKLTSSHIMQEHIDKSENVLVDKKKFTLLYPNKYTKEQLDKIDDNGLAKAGVKLNPGDPFALVLHKNTGTNEDLMLNRLHKSLVQPFKDASQTWHGSVPGEVVKSLHNTSNAKVHIKKDTPAVVGDKLSLRHGNKGVITAILPDQDMPHKKDGEHAEVLISPLSVITRMSMGQLLENSASKIAKKTGKPYLIKNFDTNDVLAKLKSDLSKHNVSDTEEFFDPKTGKSLGQVMAGYPVVQKLFKTTEGNLSARETGSYDIDNRPMRHGEEGSKSVDALTLYSLMSHGHRGILNEISTIKGDGNADFWHRLENGLPLPKPQTPFAYKKFESFLNASGINIKQDGSKKILMPLTDKQVHEMAGNNELDNFKMLDHNLEPVKGGLFDPSKTGGTNGQKWSKITLAHPVVNPMFEQAVKSVLDLKDSDFKNILKEENGHDKIKSMLKDINIKEEIDNLKSNISSAAKTKKDKMLKKLKLLKALDHLNLSADEAYTLSAVPVVPPQFRPVFQLPNGSLNTTSLNLLYRDLGLTNQTIKELGKTPDLSNTLYQSLGAIQGIMSPVSKQNEIKGVKGSIEIISGSSPKFGFFQNKVLRKQQDLSGRATVVLNNNLHMDQIAIPQEVAKSVYKPFALKELTNLGYLHKDAEKHIEDMSEIGTKAIQSAMKDRPILMNRAPSLHKFSIMAFQPTLTKGKSIEVPGLIVSPYSMDFDGDTATLHVPVGEQARKEAFEMLPSKNLYNPRNKQLAYTLDQEAVLGLHLLSQTPEGRKQINSILPKYAHVSDPLNKKYITSKILEEIAHNSPDKYNELATKLKELGDKHATAFGFSLSLNDLVNNSKLVKEMYKPVLQKKYKNDEEKLKLMFEADTKAKAYGILQKDNNLVTMASSGARGSAEQVKQILMAPGILTDHNGSPILRPVLSNYGTGMAFPDYWTTSYAARKGALDKQLMTSKPGALNKEIVNTNMHFVITKHDCGTTHGIKLDVNDPSLVGRSLAENGQLVTPTLAKTLKAKHKTVIVRSPATCELTKGVCQKCYGIDEYGSLPKIGMNIGIKASQSISEPLTQAAMKTFHTGGTASGGGGVLGGFDVISTFLEAPETFKNKATLASLNGTVTKIEQNPAGGHFVYIDDKQHFIAPHSGDLKVKKGDTVEIGDTLNHGMPHPKEIIETLGAKKGIERLTDTLNNLYVNSGLFVDRKNLETVVRGMTGFGVIKNEGNHPKFVQNDVAPLHLIEQWNKQADTVHSLPVHETHGMILQEKTGNFHAGSIIDKHMIDTLQHSHKNIKVKHQPITYDRTLIGVKQAPTKSMDWLGHIGYRYIKKGLQEGAMYGHESDIHGVHPVAPFVTGQLSYSPDGSY